MALEKVAIRRGLLSIAVTGLLAVPAIAGASSANAAQHVRPHGPTNEVYWNRDVCEARAAQIRDGITGAWCEWDWSGPGWRLWVSGA